jgi:hypothetical protein
MQTIIAGAGAQAVEVYATDARGALAKPSGATYRIVDLAYTEDDPDADRIVVVAATAATIDTFADTITTVLAGPRSPDPRRVAITAGVPVVGRQYKIAGGGNSEEFTVDRVDSLNVYARSALRFPYAIGATVSGLRVYATFPSVRANLANELDRRTDYAVDFVFAGTTGSAYRRVLCRIERRGVAPRATVEDMLEADPRLEAASRERSTLEKNLRTADREFTAKLLHRGDAPADRDDGEAARFAVVWRAIQLAWRGLSGDAAADAAAEAKLDADRWEKMAIGGRKPADVVEVARATDGRRGTRRPESLGLVTE